MAVQTLDKVTAKPVKRDRKAEAARRAQKKVEPAKPENTRDFYADLKAGNPTAGFVASHGTWQNWTSNIQTPDGRRGIQETKLIPCACDLCQNAIKKNGWTF